MKRPWKPPRNAVDVAIDALGKRKGPPSEEDRPKPSTLPGRKVKPLRGQLNLDGDEWPHD